MDRQQYPLAVLLRLDPNRDHSLRDRLLTAARTQLQALALKNWRRTGDVRLPLSP
jgi:hypothetical protein